MTAFELRSLIVSLSCVGSTWYIFQKTLAICAYLMCNNRGSKSIYSTLWNIVWVKIIGRRMRRHTHRISTRDIIFESHCWRSQWIKMISFFNIRFRQMKQYAYSIRAVESTESTQSNNALQCKQMMFFHIEKKRIVQYSWRTVNFAIETA